MSTEDEKFGVTIGFFKAFVEICESKFGPFPKDATVKYVADNYVKSLTADAKVALSSLSYHQPELRKYVGVGTHFISHAWEAPFFELMKAIEDHFAGKEDGVYLWIDLFCFNQQIQAPHSTQFFTEAFKKTIKSFQEVVIVFYPWQNPKPLKRAWCLWEIFCTIDGNIHFNVALSGDQQEDFLQKMSIIGENTFRDMIQGLNSRKSDSFLKEDRDHIHQAIEANGGFYKIDTVIIRKMREWITQVAKNALDRQTDPILKANLKQVIATLYKEQAMYQESEPIQKEALSDRMRLLGEFHHDTMVSKNSLGTLYLRQGNYLKAEPELDRCLQVRTKLYEQSGSADDRVVYLKSMNNLGLVYENTERISQAELLYRTCFSLQKIHQPNESSTFSTMTNLANCLVKNGNYKEAESLYLDSYQGRSHGGDEERKNHPSSLSTLHKLGELYLLLNENEKAYSLFADVYPRRRSVLGDTHPKTLETERFLNQLGSEQQLNVSI